MIRVTILGSTGSIGKSTLNLLSYHRDKFRVVALSANTRIDLLFLQCQQFNPIYAVVGCGQGAASLKTKLREVGSKTIVLSGAKALEEIASFPETDYVMAAIVGAAGLLSTLAAIHAGKRVLLANKESLVMSGGLLMKAIRQSGATLFPVDSEHSAIFQCMPERYQIGDFPAGVQKIILTASGGPFRTTLLSELDSVTPEQAVHHPNWSMGAKISVDSATMMNKALEVIEAYWLFNLDFLHIEVVIHPQSIIHSLVSYEDGSVLAQMGSPDMQTPIACALSWPDRLFSPVKPLNLIEIGQMTFEKVDTQRFPSIELAYAVLKAGGTASTLLNAANEVAVAAFLNREIPFTAINKIVAEVLERVPVQVADCVEAILEADKKARIMAEKICFEPLVA